VTQIVRKMTGDISCIYVRQVAAHFFTAVWDIWSLLVFIKKCAANDHDYAY